MRLLSSLGDGGEPIARELASPSAMADPEQESPASRF